MSVCSAEALSAAPEKLTVAVEPDTLTDTSRPLVAVLATLKPSVNCTDEPSKPSTSLDPSETFVTVSVSEVKVCPASTVEAVTPLNRSTAEPPSVNAGSVPVAVSVGSSSTKLTVDVTAALSPSWSRTTIVNTRLDVSGRSESLR